MLFLLPEMLTLLLVGWFFFGVPVKGSLLVLLIVILLGAFAFAGLGLLLGCRTEKTESISGLINLVMLPMYLRVRRVFPVERFPEAVQPFIRALPLTQLNDALRLVMLEGAGLGAIGRSPRCPDCLGGHNVRRGSAVVSLAVVCLFCTRLRLRYKS